MPGTGDDKDAENIGSLFQDRPRSARWLFAAVFILSIGIGMFLATLAKGQELVGPITHVTDGDTIRLCQDGRCHSIRLCGVNAPEAGEPQFVAARIAMQRIVANTTIVCRPVGQGTICDGRSLPKSRDRIVAQCFTATGKDRLPAISRG